MSIKLTRIPNPAAAKYGWYVFRHASIGTYSELKEILGPDGERWWFSAPTYVPNYQSAKVYSNDDELAVFIRLTML